MICVILANIRKGLKMPYNLLSVRKPGVFQGLFSSLKQQPDLIYRMDGDSHDTWFYVMPNKDDISLLDMNSLPNL